MGLYRTTFTALMAGTMLAGLPARAGAQDTAATASATTSTLNEGDIVVTATKRSESLQRVPISMQALTPALLEQNQVSSFDDYARLLPSVSYQSFGPGQAQLYFRGITTGGDGLHAGPLPTTGLYLDEVPLTTVAGAVDLHVYDMARVEALSGPQGTLYGASSLSGTLRLITAKPDPTKFEAGYDLELNKFGEGDAGGTIEGFVNLPLSETSALRLMGFYQRDGGYIDNLQSTRTYLRPTTDPAGGDPINNPLVIDNSLFAEENFNDVETYGGRAALRIDLNDDWTVTPAGIYQHQDTQGAFLFDPRAGDLAVRDFTPSFTKDKWWLASLTVQGKLSNWDVTYAGSYFRRTYENIADYSYFNVAYDSYTDYNFYQDAAGRDIDPTQTFRGFDRYTKQSHEFRVSSPSDNRLRVTAGLFYQRQTNFQIAEYILNGLRNAVNPFSPPVPGGGADDVYFTRIFRVDRDYAVFGEGAFDISDRLKLNAGIRVFKARNTLDGFSGGAGAATSRQPNCLPQNALDCPNIDKLYKESGETHKVNLTYQIDPDRMVYATYSTGFRPGGNNRDAFALGQAQIIPPFKSDTITNYEIGWKTSFLDRRLRINGALFWEEWNKVQYSLPGILGIYYTVNAGKARSRGIEGDITWRDNGLTLSTSGTLLEAELTQPFCAQAGCDPATGGELFAPAGTRLPIQPSFKINATARYDFTLGTTDSFVQGVANHQSGTRQYLTDAGNATIGNTDGFTTFDFSIGASFSNFNVSAYIQNAFDKRGILSKNSVCTPGICGPYSRLYAIKPQIFGVKVGQRF